MDEGDPEELIDPAFAAGVYPSLKDADLVESSMQSGALDAQAGGAFTVGQALCMRPVEATEDETAADVVPGAPVAVYANSAPETDTLIRATPLGDILVMHARGANAPETFSWRIRLDSELEKVVELPNGGLALVNTEGSDLPEQELPSNPSNANEPAGFVSVEAQIQASLYDLAVANNVAAGQVLAVIPPPVAINSEGEQVAAELTYDPFSKRISATRPEEAAALIMRPSSALIHAQSVRVRSQVVRNYQLKAATTNPTKIETGSKPSPGPPTARSTTLTSLSRIPPLKWNPVVYTRLIQKGTPVN
jgi:hypothetical protein